MTRINLVPPEELTDQHLMAEYREMPMVSAALRRSLRTRTKASILRGIPRDFTLNKGHVTFFYDKLKYLSDRYDLVRAELLRRGYKLDPNRGLNADGFPPEFYRDYKPTEAALKIIRTRIAEKIAMKPDWYRHTLVEEINDGA